jgi:hypothetical protein
MDMQMPLVTTLGGLALLGSALPVLRKMGHFCGGPIEGARWSTLKRKFRAIFPYQLFW